MFNLRWRYSLRSVPSTTPAGQQPRSKTAVNACSALRALRACFEQFFAFPPGGATTAPPGPSEKGAGRRKG
eukprot:8223497-Alexandrium_andersonii.AAC.1